MGTNNRTLYAAVLGLALGGLAVDRFILGGAELGPASALASAPTEQPESSPEATTPAELSDDVPANSVLASRLSALRQLVASDAPEEPADPFGVLSTSQPESEARSEAVALRETFLRDHTLNSVMISGQARVAVIGGRPLQVGDEVGGFTLESIEKDSAELACGQVRVRLNVPAPGGPETGEK
ncbi:MAG TPA: hypothetical protein VD963_07595 [Phycisphaerales bacterium]|nr:hypothetical protein [Phycisphaerales bacterium]